MPKNVWPPEIPVSRPRSTISMPRVTTNPLSPNRTISRALSAPTSTPTTSTTGTAAHDGRSPREWPPPIVSQAATPGARPNVDSSERSILPTTRTSVWASTSRAISDMVCRMLSTLSYWRNTGFTSWPTTAIARIPGTRAKSRRRAKAMRRGGRAAPGSVCSSARSTVGLSGIEVDSFHGGHDFAVRPAGGEFGGEPPVDHDEHAVAETQVVQLVGGDQHRGARGGGFGHLAEEE